MPAPPVLLRGADRAAFAVALTMRLRVRAVPVGLTATERFARALAAAPPTSRSQLYWTARICLVQSVTDLAAFDRVFAAVFDAAVLPADPNARRIPRGAEDARDQRNIAVPAGNAPSEDDSGLPWVTLPPVVAPADDSDAATVVPHRLPGRLAGLADTPFDQLSPSELEQLGVWLQGAITAWPTRRSRRTRVAPGGHRIALRATIRRSRRTGFEPVELLREGHVRAPRRLLMLCDTSQSMQAQATAYLHLMRAFVLATDAEAFAFATRLTRLTTVLTHKSPDVAVAHATEKVADRFGGTRIATNVQQLLSSHHGNAVRGAIVVVASDGWDSDPPEQLAAAMSRLRRRAHRVVWINPRAGAPGFRPEVASMAAALGYCDELLPADTFASLLGVIAAIAPREVSSRASRGPMAGSVRP